MGENYETDTKDWGFFTAAQDLRLYQWHIVKLASATTVDLCTSTDTPFGILQNKPNIGQVAKVRIKGVSRVWCSTAGLAVADQYGADDDSHAVARATDKQLILGECLVARTDETSPATVTVDGGIKHTLSLT